MCKLHCSTTVNFIYTFLNYIFGAGGVTGTAIPGVPGIGGIGGMCIFISAGFGIGGGGIPAGMS
jgi:hypothetical protein